MPATHADAPVFRHLVHRLSDPEQFEIAVSGVCLKVDFLGPQKLATRVEQFQAADWAFDFHQAHVKARVLGPLPPGWASLGLMRSPAPSSWHGIAASQGLLACNPPGEPIDGYITPGFSCMAVSLPVVVWEKCRALAGIDCSTSGRFSAIRLPASLYATLERRLRATRLLLRMATGKPHLTTLATREAADLATEIATSAWELSVTRALPRDSLRNRARLARRAEAWMRENCSEFVRIPDLCLALRVSRRELEYAFRTAFDESPRHFLRALRLNAIRRALHRTDASILEIALDHGITHLSRFAADYRNIFGERPSKTARK